MCSAVNRQPKGLHLVHVRLDNLLRCRWSRSGTKRSFGNACPMSAVEGIADIGPSRAALVAPTAAPAAQMEGLAPGYFFRPGLVKHDTAHGKCVGNREG